MLLDGVPGSSQPRHRRLPGRARAPARHRQRRGRRAHARRRRARPRSPSEYGTPLVVYDEATLRAAGARLPRGGARTRSSSTGRRRSRTSRCMRLLAEEGIGADVSTLGELAFAQRAGIAGRPHRRPRQQQVGRGARGGRRGRRRWSCSTRSSEIDRARAGRRDGACSCESRPGIDADTHEAIKTGHHGSKFGLPPDDALEAIAARPRRARWPARPRRLAADATSARRRSPSTGSPASPPAPRAELGWEPRSSTSAAGSASATCSTSRARRRGVRRRRCSSELDARLGSSTSCRARG